MFRRAGRPPWSIGTRAGGRVQTPGTGGRLRLDLERRRKTGLVASRVCDYLAGSTFRPDDVAMPGTAALRLTDEVFLNFDHRHQRIVNRKDKA